MSDYNIKRDKYKHARGGDSRLLNIFCRKCERLVVVYQKDGPGNLYRLYLDRILEPAELANLDKFTLKDIKPLRCPACQEFLATPYIYPKEKRPAFRLYSDAVFKRLKK